MDVTTTLEDVRAKAKKSFVVAADSGLRVYIGENLDNIVFIADELEWKEELALLLQSSKPDSLPSLPSRTLYILEVMPSNQSSLQPAKPKSGQSTTPTTAAGVSIGLTTTPIELEQAIKAVTAAKASNLRGSGGNN